MNTFQLLAQPWWVNLLVLLPFVIYFVWRKKGLHIPLSVLATAGIFAIAFGFNEAVVVVYLRAAVGLLPGYGGTFTDVMNLSSGIYQQSQSLAHLPPVIVSIEFFREAATMVMLLCVAGLSMKDWSGRAAVFFWSFAFWDIFYYVGLWATVRWPGSLLSPDVLFLIPVPWLSQVWFPILISCLSILAVISVNKRP